jgi:hypothetical protein
VRKKYVISRPRITKVSNERNPRLPGDVTPDEKAAPGRPGRVNRIETNRTEESQGSSGRSRPPECVQIRNGKPTSQSPTDAFGHSTTQRFAWRKRGQDIA